MSAQHAKNLKGRFYQHYKGGRYLVTGVAVSTEEGEELVLYRAFAPTEECKKGITWARRMDEFFGQVKGEPRFQEIGPCALHQ